MLDWNLLSRCCVTLYLCSLLLRSDGQSPRSHNFSMEQQLNQQFVCLPLAYWSCMRKLEWENGASLWFPALHNRVWWKNGQRWHELSPTETFFIKEVLISQVIWTPFSADTTNTTWECKILTLLHTVSYYTTTKHTIYHRSAICRHSAANLLCCKSDLEVCAYISHPTLSYRWQCARVWARARADRLLTSGVMRGVGVYSWMLNIQEWQ